MVTVSVKILFPATLWLVVSFTVVESNVAISASLLVICVCNVCPVVTKLLVSDVMSPSFDVIWVCKVCPVVIRFPLMSSAIAPVETKLVETVFMSVVKV